MKARWIDVVPGSTVIGRDGYEWRVINVQTAPTGKPQGSVAVTMARIDSGREVTGWPPGGTEIEVLSVPEPAPGAERVAVALIKESLGAEVLSCGWCAGNDKAECVCDVNCGATGCVNF